jgi:hypothetical protein
MTKKINIIWMILIFSLLFSVRGLAQHESYYALIQKPVFTNPETIWKLTRGYASNEWGVQLYINPSSTTMGYFMDASPYLFSALSFTLDHGWNRLVYSECKENWIKAFGDRGSGTNEFLWPERLDCVAPCNAYWTSYLYYIYAADASNDRIVKLKYRWYPPGAPDYQAISWNGEITGGGLRLPKDLDINDGGSFYPHDDDYLWVLSGDHIKRFSTDGTLQHNYGSYGCDQFEGHFCHPAAVVCGRDPFADEPFTNNNSIYVIDKGNNRLVWLYKSEMGEDIYWIDELQDDFTDDIVDLETDIYGQIWAVDWYRGWIIKYDPELYPLCWLRFAWPYYWTDFNCPVSFSNYGGYLGCGNVFVAEAWTDTTGGQYFAIGTDLHNFRVFPGMEYQWHYITYTLIDPSDVIIEIYDQQEQLVDTIFNAREYSGACVHIWDGTDQSGQPVGSGYYRVVVTDSASYRNIETGQRANVMIEDEWFYHVYTSGLESPWDLAGYQSGPDKITLEWEYTESPGYWFTVFCDGCLCGAVEPLLPHTYTDSSLITDQSYIYWVTADTGSIQSDPSNADTVFVESKLFPVATILDKPTEQNFVGPLPASISDTTTEVAIQFSTVYPGHSAEMAIMLRNPDYAIYGFNLLIKLQKQGGVYPGFLDFHTNEISVDSTLIGDSEWVHYPVRHCWIDTTGSTMSNFTSLSCRGQVADTSLPHCKYLWVKAWAPPGNYIPPSSNYDTLFKFGVDAGCISDTLGYNRSVAFDLDFGRFYGRQKEVPFKYNQGELLLWWSVHGDANNDSLVTGGDVVYIQDYLFRGGPPPCIPETGDPNNDCTIGAGDVVYLLSYLYRGGPPPLPGCWHGE